MLRQIQQLDEEHRQNQELLRNLSSPAAYYRIVASDGNVSTINMTEGALSQYGGLITVRLSNEGDVTIHIGGVDDGRGGVKTIVKTFHNPAIQNIVLGVADTDIEVNLLCWFEGENFQHLAVQTIDGIIATLPLNASDPEVMIPMEVNLRKEECTDQKQVLYEDIEVLLERPHIIMFSHCRNDSVRVRLLKYLQGPEFQHLLVCSLDGFLFEIDGDSYPYKSIFSIDMTSSSKSCNISCASLGSEYNKVSRICGATAFSNYITGSNSRSLITGGNMADYLHGNQGSEKIEGF
ncbi:UNVERIFIED_CONTAM: hypothetical protein FKN15_055673 [Acipenser sinensis]